MNDVIMQLRDKDEKAAYEFAKQIGAESAESDKYLELIPEFAGMLSDKSSYTRTRGFFLICNQARWADKGQIENVFDDMTELLYDKKPSVVRQCIGALHELVLYRPELTDRIRSAVNKINLSSYKDSMSPLIEKDMNKLLSAIDGKKE